MNSITFFGGAGSVTGSKHLVQINNKKILLDCGMFQGVPNVHSRNRSFSFAPKSIDAVVLSHAHLDHCGMLPLLVKQGFQGNIFSTPATQDIVEYIISDAAGIEMQDSIYRKAHTIGNSDEHEPLFTKEDIPYVMERFVSVPYARTIGTWTAKTFSSVRRPRPRAPT